MGEKGRGTLGTAGVLLAVVWLSAPCDGEDLQQAWGAALTANPTIEAGRLGTAAAQNDLAAARRERVPNVRTVNAQTFLSTQPTFKSDISGLSNALGGAGASVPSTLMMPFSNQNFFFSSTMASVPVYTGGRIDAGVDKACAGVGVANAAQATTAQELKLQVARAYLEVLRLEKLFALAQTNVASLTAHERDVQNLLKQGMVNRNDLLAAQVSLARGRQRVLEAGNGLDTARAAYNRLLARPLMTPVLVEEVTYAPFASPPATDPTAMAMGGQARSPAEEGEIQRLTTLAMASRPELAGLAHQARALEADAALTDAAHRPQVGLVGGYTYVQNNYLRDPNFFSGSLVAEWLLVDGHKAKRRADAYRLREMQTVRMRQDAASQVALAIRQSWEKSQSDRARLDVARKAISGAEENLRVARDRYKEQTGTNTEVLDAETLRLQTHTDYYNAYYDLLGDDYTLRRAAGVL